MEKPRLPTDNPQPAGRNSQHEGVSKNTARPANAPIVHAPHSAIAQAPPSLTLLPRMNDNPWLQLCLIATGLYVTYLWWTDYRAAHTAIPAPSSNPFPGATAVPRKALWIAATGAALILAAETCGEIALGLDDEQSKITVLFGIYTLIAAIIEEIIFRGFLVVENRGRTALLCGIIGASLLFALIHPFLWKWDDEGFALTLTAKGWFSFAAVLAGSLWFYTCRFASWNPARSLLPCFAAHFTKNAGVFAIKAIQGFVAGTW